MSYFAVQCDEADDGVPFVFGRWRTRESAQGWLDREAPRMKCPSQHRVVEVGPQEYEGEP